MINAKVSSLFLWVFKDQSINIISHSTFWICLNVHDEMSGVFNHTSPALLTLMSEECWSIGVCHPCFLFSRVCVCVSFETGITALCQTLSKPSECKMLRNWAKMKLNDRNVGLWSVVSHNLWNKWHSKLFPLLNYDGITKFVPDNVSLYICSRTGNTCFGVLVISG